MITILCSFLNLLNIASCPYNTKMIIFSVSSIYSLTFKKLQINEC
uniref:Uncharacterized protein n=1 Tax=Rhizophora mucronata TaxID=61149 RepID=A0A2P2Q7M6_RHIMU